MYSLISPNKYKNIFKEIFFQTTLSTIYKCQNKIIKRIKKHNKFNYKTEYNILKTLDDPNIMKIIEYYEDKDYFYTVMQHYQRGDLHYNIYNHRINIKDYKSIINKFINPITVIHQQNIIHLDLKLENYLLKDNENYLLFDFNFSKIHNYKYYDLIKLDYIVGTKNYTSPEVENGYYCKSSDMYSLGCILHLIYTREKFDNKDASYTLLNNVNNNLKNLILDLLDEDHKLRPTVYDINYYLN
jgi:calcium-dependent protein kinase